MYKSILDALEIPWVARTDNDVSKITLNGIEMRNLAGINRALTLAKFKKYSHVDMSMTAKLTLTNGLWEEVSKQINQRNVFLSKIDLENDLSLEVPGLLLEFTKKETIEEAVKYLANKKALRMREFLAFAQDNIAVLSSGEIAKPLYQCISLVEGGNK